mmetsp:Transcript_16280/g.56897  ORF Transcript_16280/g.56897 Transcript_16280/m.56897 type:complete len:241 (-) Transcript_16280:645-1367(-)
MYGVENRVNELAGVLPRTWGAAHAVRGLAPAQQRVGQHGDAAWQERLARKLAPSHHQQPRHQQQRPVGGRWQFGHVHVEATAGHRQPLRGQHGRDEERGERRRPDGTQEQQREHDQVRHGVSHHVALRALVQRRNAARRRATKSARLPKEVTQQRGRRWRMSWRRTWRRSPLRGRRRRRARRRMLALSHHRRRPCSTAAVCCGSELERVQRRGRGRLWEPAHTVLAHHLSGRGRAHVVTV